MRQDDDFAAANETHPNTLSCYHTHEAGQSAALLLPPPLESKALPARNDVFTEAMPPFNWPSEGRLLGQQFDGFYLNSVLINSTQGPNQMSQTACTPQFPGYVRGASPIANASGSSDSPASYLDADSPGYGWWSGTNDFTDFLHHGTAAHDSGAHLPAIVNTSDKSLKLSDAGGSDLLCSHGDTVFTQKRQLG